MSKTGLACSICGVEFEVDERYVTVGVQIESCDADLQITPIYAEATEMYHLRCAPNQLGIEFPRKIVDGFREGNSSENP